jgi:uncharacterized protein YbjT (DUF2867 family)
MILVLGARGTLGHRVAARLLAAGERVRAVSRDPAGLDGLAALGAEAVRGDLLEDGWQEAALAGVERVVLASHGLYPPSRSNHPQAVDGEGTRRLIDAAARVGVRQFVYVSAAGAAPDAVRFMRVKYATEQHLRRSGLGWTIIRPTVFIENNALVHLGEPLRAGKPVPFLGPGTSRVNWVSADDVADEIVRALSDESALGRVRELRGPDTLSRVECLELLAAALGREPRRRHLPLAAVRVLHAIAGPLHPGMAALLSLVLADPGPPADPVDAEVRVGPTHVAEVAARWASHGLNAPD